MGCPQLMNGLCSKVCLWSVAWNAEASSHHAKARLVPRPFKAGLWNKQSQRIKSPCQQVEPCEADAPTWQTWVAGGELWALPLLSFP